MTDALEIEYTIQGILANLIAGYGPPRVILFGSYPYGMPRPDSDLDLLIIKDTPERFLDRWSRVRHILSDPARMIPIETIVLAPEELSRRLAKGDQIIGKIVKRGRVFYDG